jgi:hypothetical protein
LFHIGLTSKTTQIHIALFPLPKNKSFQRGIVVQTPKDWIAGLTAKTIEEINLFFCG